MSLTFGPEFMGVALTPENARVTVTKWDGAPVTLTQDVVIDSQGRVSFTVPESGVYKVTARRAVYNDYYSIKVTLSDGPDFDPSDVRSTLNYLLEQVAEGGGGPGGPVDWDDVQDKPAVIAAGATQADARAAVGAGTSSFSGSYPDLTSKPTIPSTAADVGAVPTTRTVAGKALSSNVTLVKADVGLANVDNTSDSAKPVSSATQTALDGKAATSHTHTATQISDSTATGRSVITAASAAAARTAIGAGTSNIAIGTGATDAKAGNYQPTAANISDATTVGRNILTATDAAAVRAAAGTAGLNTVGSLQGVFIPNGGTIPPEAVSPYIVVIEQA